ncbi:MAG: YdcF family protein [Gammaproteobacteria bacterium]|nr:YdcF family protein [Gammaproteobacteria bacterium]MBU1624367.1 YdcF family protein [Gammaproteobacteria bacterium]MBU1981095.1 YdcF family protein [Gammaproteobacteria bacterium]
MSWLLTNLVSAFLLPPLNLLLMAGIGLFLWHKRPRTARILVSVSVAGIWLLSTPFVADSLLQSIEDTPVDLSKTSADAIVVLSGGQHFNATEYGGNTVSKETLERVRYAATLYRQTGKPVLVSGGNPQGGGAEAPLMKKVLEQEYYVPVRWVEDTSDNTLENAHHSHSMLAREGIERIYLITQAWHMPRSVQVFESAGFTVVPAATAYTTRYETNLLTFVPNAGALLGSYHFMHEVIGMLWYRLKS